MLTKIPIRLRLTILSILLLSACCVALTVILNFSAGRMANEIEAILVTPAQTLSPEAETTPPIPALDLVSTMPPDESQLARNNFLNTSVLCMILVVALGGGLTYYISGKALKPLENLSAQMKNRTVHNLSESLPVPESHDEITQLTLSFNEMSEKLESAFAAQKRFSQSAAHELRTPLTVLKTKVEVFKKKPQHSAQEYDMLLHVITTHTDRLACLVEDLLSLTNMDALDCSENVELDKILVDVCYELSDLATGKNITISTDFIPQNIAGNKSLLHRAFYNLVENAVKYNVHGGIVTVSISSTDKFAAVTIRDTGIGIPKDVQLLIFEPFYRVDKSRSRQMGGAGLGLATVQSIVQKHGGEIKVLGNPQGGTIFEVKLVY